MAEWKAWGAVFYYLISLTLSIIIVAGVSCIDALGVDSTMKGVGLGILSVEIMSQLTASAAASSDPGGRYHCDLYAPAGRLVSYRPARPGE